MDSHSHDPRHRLDELRRSTVRRAEDLVASFDGIVAAASDVATDDEHDPEGHTIAWERQQLASLLEATRATLDAIDAAERRLVDGGYGICTTCGSAINHERLEALPATAHCLGCA